MSGLVPLLFAAYPLLLSGWALVWLLRSRLRRLSDWTLRTLACASIVGFAFLAGPWSYTSHYLRYAALGLFVVAAAYSFVRMKRSAPGGAPPARISAASLVILLLFAGLDAAALASYHPRAEPLGLTFPLGPGTYCVLQGGSSPVTNPFHAASGKRQALDIVELNAFGNRARGLVPRELAAYEIFGDGLYSPCAGSVSAVRDDLPDNPPGDPDRDHPEGNFVELACGEARVVIGHLQRGSVEVVQGERVAARQPIARVGNSGNTLEPHVHIEAWSARGELGLSFDGRTLSVNSLVRGRAQEPLFESE